MAQYFNISGELTQELLAAGSNVSVNKIYLTNVQKVAKCKVDLYIEKQLTGKFYLLKGVELPIGATLLYDNVSFNNSVGEYGLYIKLTDGDNFVLTGSIDVTGTNTDVPGTNTLYTSELSVGDEILVTGETRTVSSITGDTTAVVSAAWGSDLDEDSSPECYPTALVDVVIN